MLRHPGPGGVRRRREAAPRLLLPLRPDGSGSGLPAGEAAHAAPGPGQGHRRRQTRTQVLQRGGRGAGLYQEGGGHRAAAPQEVREVRAAAVLPAPGQEQPGHLHRGRSRGEVRPGLRQHQRVQPEAAGGPQEGPGDDDQADQRHGQVQLRHRVHHRRGGGGDRGPGGGRLLRPERQSDREAAGEEGHEQEEAAGAGRAGGQEGQDEGHAHRQPVQVGLRGTTGRFHCGSTKPGCGDDDDDDGLLELADQPHTETCCDAFDERGEMGLF